MPGSPKTHGEKQTCPDEVKLAPCRCKVKTSGLDVTCQAVSRAQMERVATVMKQQIKPTTDVRDHGIHNKMSKILPQIRYFKVRESTLHKLPDYIFMGLSIVHLMIYNSSRVFQA